MNRTAILGTGRYLPEMVVTNDMLAARMDTSDEWIQQRTGIKERRHVDFDTAPMETSDLGARAGAAAIKDAGLEPADIDLIIDATLSSDRIFPGDGVLVQAKLDIPAGVPALDIRNQCSGFIYGLSVADAFVRSGAFKRILLIGAEIHSSGVDMTDKGRDVAVLFGDGAGAVILGPTDDNSRGILGTEIHADGRYAGELQIAHPSSGHSPRTDIKRIEAGEHFPQMNGRNVFKHASTRMPETMLHLLEVQGFTSEDIDLLIPHQANLRISEMVQKKLKLRDDQVFNNIQRYGNTTAASIPIAIDEAKEQGKLQPGMLLALAAFGSGFTWASALIKL